VEKILKKLLCFLLIPFISMTVICAAGDSPAAAKPEKLYEQLRDIKFSGKAVPVKNLVLKRDAAVFTFKEGTFYVLETVDDRCTGAVFMGTGEISMTPVLKVEQQHLEHLTGGPSITETFSKMVLRFTDESFKEITASGDVKDMSPVSKAESYFKKHTKLIRKGKKYLRPNIAVSLLRYNLDLRLLMDITAMTPPRGGGFFYAFFNGKKYGDMMFTFDPLGARFAAPEEVMLACLGKKNLGIWTAEHRREFYSQNSGAGSADNHRLVDMEHYDIDAVTSREDLVVVVTARFKALVDGLRVLPLELFPKLRMITVTDTAAGILPFIQEKYDEDADFAIIFPEGLQKGKQYTVTFEYGGREAVRDEGGGNFTLVARSTWYPNTGLGDRATYNMTFRTPADLDVVATGKLVENEIKGKTRISRWKSDIPLVVAGFNYGQFKKSVIKEEKSNVTIESYANINVPDMIEGLKRQIDEYERSTGVPSGITLGNLDTAKLMGRVRAEAQAAVMLYTDMYGPMPFDRVAVSQQPFPHFGQAWPTLVYMPIIAYFSGTHLSQLDLISSLNFVKYVCAHEIGHQWWGHAVGWKSYRSQWIGEAFSQLSASLFVQAVYKNAKFIEFWRDLRKDVLTKNRMRKCPAKIGSVTLGYRLDTARTGYVGDAVTYAKGAFVAHMLRMMMSDHKTGDARFSAMLKDFFKTYYHRDVSTEDFKRVVEKHMTPAMNLDGNGKMDWFFNQWILGTNIPHYTLDYRLEKAPDGKFKLACKVTQSKVDDSFKMRVPIYLVFHNNRVFRLGSVVVKGNGTSQELKVLLPKKPKRVLLCAFEDVLCTIKGRN
jgi:hypothetical protein